MKKGLITTLCVAAFSFAGFSAFASAPTISQLPDVTIGDAEDNGASDNNFFRFPDAFRFDDYVRASVPVTGLLWSFDEHDSPAGTQAQWFQVNTKDPIHVGDANIALDGVAATEHVNPVNELRSTSETASFRDIVFSPAAGTPPFPTPSENHSAGKLVRFYVSDSTNVASCDIMVKTIDEGFDSITGGINLSGAFQVKQDDDFSTDSTAQAPATNGWAWFAQHNSGLGTQSWNSGSGPFKGTTGAYIGTVVANPAGNHFRATGYVSNGPGNWLPFSQIGTTNYVRVKYYMYGIPNPSTAAFNVIPNLRVRASARYAVNSMLEVLAHANGDPAANAKSVDFAPSTDPTKPSLYRVDFAPIMVPYLLSAGDTEGVLRAFEAYSTDPQDAGVIGMTESVIGIYPSASLDDSRALAGNQKVYAVGATDAGDLKNVGGSTDTNGQLIYGGTLQPNLQVFNMIPASDEGGFAALDTVGLGSYHEGTFGVTMDTRAVASTGFKIGLVLREFDPGTDNASHVRVAENQQYKIRWHVTSAQDSNKNSQIRLRSRTAKFNWTQKYELGGAWAVGSGFAAGNNAIAQQALPGVGCQNPDKNGTENGGWYTMIMHTPLSLDIRPDKTGDILARMPNLAAEPGPGSAAASLRDLKLGVDVVDSISSGANYALEQGLFTIDRIEVKSFNLVDDGGY